MIMTTSLEATDRDFEQMMQMLTGAWVTQIAGAVATYSIADHLAKKPADNKARRVANCILIFSSFSFFSGCVDRKRVDLSQYPCTRELRRSQVDPSQSVQWTAMPGAAPNERHCAKLAVIPFPDFPHQIVADYERNTLGKRSRAVWGFSKVKRSLD